MVTGDSISGLRSPRRTMVWLPATLLVAAAAHAQVLCNQGTCRAPDNGAGTVDLPGPCPFRSPHGETIDIVGGLPKGTQIECDFRIDSFFDITYAIGGELGGQIESYSAVLLLDMQGTGALQGFARQISMPITVETHSGARAAGAPVQSFPTEMFMVQGAIFGDPDFDLLTLTGGTGLGLPSPGQTTLTRLPDGDFTVDSFFDITYRIDFQGAPGSILEGMGGTTEGASVFVTNSEPGPAPTCVQPDNGTGTIDHPAVCPYASPDGIPDLLNGQLADTQLRSDFTVDSFFDITYQIGGSLGGEVEQMQAAVTLQLQGTGALQGFQRVLTIPAALQIHTAPRTPGASVQSFDTDLFLLQGALFGDPDFDQLTIMGGAGLGLPSPGHTTLTRLGDGSFNVDSFFDISYRIDFQGAPGSLLEGLGGSTQGTLRMEQGQGELPGPAVVFGLPHVPVGSACLSTDAGGHLTVSNIGSSGKDGVAVDLGAADGFLLELDPGTKLLPGSLLQLDAFAALAEGTGGQRMLGLELLGAGEGLATGALDLSVFGFIPGEIRATARLGGQDLGTVVLTPPYPDVLFVSNIGSSGKDGVSIDVSCCDEDCDDGRVSIRLRNPIAGTMIVTGGPVVFADELVLCIDADADGDGIPDLPEIGRLELRAANVPMVSILDEALGRFGNQHRALGQTHMTGFLDRDSDNDTLVVSNIGSSGEDGVSIDLGELDHCGVCACQPGWDLDFGPAGGLPPGGHVAVRALLDIPGIEPQCAWCYHVTAGDDGRASISADLDLLNPATLRVEARRGGKTLDSRLFKAPFPDTLTVSNIGSSGKDGVSVDYTHDGSTAQWAWAWPVAGPTTIFGGKGVIADELRFTANGVDNDCDSPSPAGVVAGRPLYEIRCSNLPHLTILDERLTPPALPCPADTDGSGVVNVTDLVRVILAWGTADPGADVNGDGIVNVADLIFVILHWGPCQGD